MADYIYLLQYRLTLNQRRALEAVRDAARALGAPVFLVGGAVRDLTSGAPVRDLDFAVQGDVSGLLDGLTAAGGRSVGEDKSFHSRYFVFPGGVRLEVGPTLAVTYPKPGVPEVVPAPILDDLRRRDFTANAMAISLNEGSYGLLLDPLNGVADLENRELRLVSNLGFIEQPALLIRAARLGNRLGWNLEERTQRRYENAKEEGAIERLPAAARGYELEEIFHEEDPVSAIEYLASEDWLRQLSPALSGLKPDLEGLDRVRDTLGQMEQLGIFADPSAVYFPFLTAKLPAADSLAIKTAFARPGFAEQIDSLEGRTRELASQLTSKASSLPSASWKLLFQAEPEVVLSLASSSRTGAAQAKFKAFFTEWPQARQRIPYGLMQEMRITPEIAGYDQLLEDLFFAIIDNKLNTPEETRAFLEPFSPPAPAQQATPRRRAAKSARGRGRPAAAAARDADLDLDEAGDEPDEDSSSRDAMGEDEDSDKVVLEGADEERDGDQVAPVADADSKDSSDEDEDEVPARTPATPVKTSPPKLRQADEQTSEPVAVTSSRRKATPAPPPMPAKKTAEAGAAVGSQVAPEVKARPASGKGTQPEPTAKKSATVVAEKNAVAGTVVAKPPAPPAKGSAKSATAKAAPVKIAAKATAAAKPDADGLLANKKAATKAIAVTKGTVPGKKTADVAKPTKPAVKATKSAPAKRSGR